MNKNRKCEGQRVLGLCAGEMVMGHLGVGKHVGVAHARHVSHGVPEVTQHRQEDLVVEGFS